MDKTQKYEMYLIIRNQIMEYKEFLFDKSKYEKTNASIVIPKNMGQILSNIQVIIPEDDFDQITNEKQDSILMDLYQNS